WIGNIVHELGGVSVREAAGTPAGEDNRLTLNARVGCPAEKLSQMVEAAMQAMPGAALPVRKLYSLTPGRPNPTYRDKTTVS
ncbi:MAG: hypothetical protein FWD53_09020, partial [Phycisphaerales bacterium]|nr:hypothetical protein [Phycisphaerales bacterium]